MLLYYILRRKSTSSSKILKITLIKPIKVFIKSQIHARIIGFKGKSMYAIIKNGCQQYKVAEGDLIKVDLISSPEGTAIAFKDILMAFDEKDTMISSDKLSKIKVQGTIQKHGRYKKIRVVKFKRRKHYMRSHGHRQDFTQVKIESIK